MKTNKKTSILILAIGLAVTISGCSTHSMWNIGDASSLIRSDLQKRYSPYEGRVFFTETALPSNVTYQVVGQVDGYKATDSNTEALLILMAERCRTNGANAVMNLKMWHQMAGWSWSAPQGQGTAVRVADTNALAGLKGYWY